MEVKDNYYIFATEKKHGVFMRIIIRSILYLFGMDKNPLSNRKENTFSQSDYDAISSDWENVGMDIYNAMKEYESQ